MPLYKKNPFDSIKGSDYIKYRPSYPKELINDIIKKYHTSYDEVVIDIGTGNGQVAIDFANAGYKIIAIDPNKNFINNGYKHPLIDYRLGKAEKTGIEKHSVDLIVIGSAIHWFDFDLFFKEAHRILKSGGVIAAFSYNPCQTIVSENKFLEKYLSDNFLLRYNDGMQEQLRKYIYDGKYTNIPFSKDFSQVEYKTYSIKKEITVQDYIELIKTTAGCIGYNKQSGKNLGEIMYSDLKDYLQENFIYEYIVFNLILKNK